MNRKSLEIAFAMVALAEQGKTLQYSIGERWYDVSPETFLLGQYSCDEEFKWREKPTETAKPVLVEITPEEKGLILGYLNNTAWGTSNTHLDAAARRLFSKLHGIHNSAPRVRVKADGGSGWLPCLVVNYEANIRE